MKNLKLLVANRSEIACRIFQTCREMGIRTVGIIAPGDEEGRHATYADEVFAVPSYLDVASIIEVAQKAQVQLIHPGYGFLSERPVFARSVEKAGLLFVGPTADTMELMGAKIAAKEFASQLGVSTLPWARVEVGGQLEVAARHVGFPLLLKASAGGGGKGMRRVLHSSDLMSAAESASAEAIAAFGDGTLFLERLLEKPRHIEVQIFGNGRGGAVHLYERECSLQRRHQKVWEEAPAPHLSSQTRENIFKDAIRLAQGTRYRSAGTLEFLVDEEGRHYFLEMNTRLQVEHPVTELITGVDLVWSQITQSLEPNQDVLSSLDRSRGHAIEVRLYAEDPAQGFIPTPGKVDRLKWPNGPGIRVDSGIEEGQSIGTQFDSMLAKLIVWAENRSRALDRLRYALEETVILGVGTNQNYLHTLVCHPQVKAGKVDTGFLDRELSSFFPTPSQDEIDLLLQLKGKRFLEPSGSGTPSRAQKHPSPWGGPS